MIAHGTNDNNEGVEIMDKENTIPETETTETAEEVPQEPVKTEKPEKKKGWICPDCGTKDIMTNFCPECGRKKDI